MSKKWLKHTNPNMSDEDSSKLVETETDDDRFSSMVQQPELT